MKLKTIVLIICLLLFVSISSCKEYEQQSGSNHVSQLSSKQIPAESKVPAVNESVTSKHLLSEISLEEIVLSIRDNGYESILQMFSFSSADIQANIYDHSIDNGDMKSWHHGSIEYAFAWSASPIPVQFEYSKDYDLFTFLFPVEFLADQRNCSVESLIAEYDSLVDKYGCEVSTSDGELVRQLSIDGIDVWLKQVGENNNSYTEEDYPASMYIGSPIESLFLK